jgi:hypothetical protein
MADTRYSLELHENTRAERVVRIALGVVCLAGAIWFIFSIRGTAASAGTAWIATGFLLVFSLWLIASGSGYTERFITISDTKVILKHNIYLPAMIFTSSSLKYVEFKALSVDFCTGKKKVTLRLGNYYQERSVAIMEAIEAFCTGNGIEARGLDKEG